MEAYERPKVSDCQDLSVFKRKRSSRLLEREIRVPDTKYFSFLSGLTVKELHDIAQESRLRGYTRFRKADLIRFVDCRCVKRLNDHPDDITHELVQRCVERRMFPIALDFLFRISLSPSTTFK